MALTVAQMTDVRRFLGYPLSGTTQTLTADQDTVYLRFGMVTMSLYGRLTTLSAAEEAIVGTYLTTLQQLETAIPGAGANIDTASAGPWTRNSREVSDRFDLFNRWRRTLAEFIGCAPGPGLAGGRLLRG